METSADGEGVLVQMLVAQQGFNGEVALLDACVVLKQPVSQFHSQGIGIFKALGPLKGLKAALEPATGFGGKLLLQSSMGHGGLSRM